MVDPEMKQINKDAFKAYSLLIMGMPGPISHKNRGKVIVPKIARATNTQRVIGLQSVCDRTIAHRLSMTLK